MWTFAQTMSNDFPPQSGAVPTSELSRRVPSATPWVAIIVPVVLGAAASGCSRTHASPDKGRPPTVRVVQPESRMVQEYVYFTGQTQAEDSVEIRARVTGYLVEMNFKPGQEISAQEARQNKHPLFRIDPRPYEAQLNRAASQRLLAESRLKLAIAENARARNLARTPGTISQQDLDRHAATEDEANAAVQAAKAEEAAAALNVEFTDIYPPLDGIVGRDLLSVGNLVTQDDTLLTTIVSSDPIHAYFDVDERTMLRVQDLIRAGKVKSVRQGGRIDVEVARANEGDTFPHQGYLDFVNNQVDMDTGTIQVRCVLETPRMGEGLPRVFTPGLFVRVRFPLGEQQEALVVPASAVGTDQGQKYVLAVSPDDVVEYRPILTGSLQADATLAVQPVQIVRESTGFRLARTGEEVGEPSLSASDRVIVGGLLRVRPAMKVSVHVEPAPVEPTGA